MLPTCWCDRIRERYRGQTQSREVTANHFTICRATPRKRFTEKQIAFALRQYGGGAQVAEIIPVTGGTAAMN